MIVRKAARVEAVDTRPFPGGYSRPSMYVQGGPPPMVASGQGCVVVDEFGDELLDFNNNFTSNIHGHAHPEIVAQITAVVGRGNSFGLSSSIEFAHAEALLRRLHGTDALKFTTSGTEAVMTAVRIARAVTNRDCVIAIDNAFHGFGDAVLGTQGPKGRRGVAAAQLESLVLIGNNDVAELEAAVDRVRPRLAAVLLDPMSNYAGLERLTEEFVTAAATLARETGALLIFDEVVNFRHAVGGMQSWYAVDPDLTALGKLIGGGMPLGAVVGTQATMGILDPGLADGMLHGGTFSGNPAAAIERLNDLGEELRLQLLPLAARYGWEIRGAGSLLRPAPVERTDVAEMQQRLWWAAYGRGVLMTPLCLMALSTPMSAETNARAVEALADAFAEVAAGR
jgi:glutamate-1-semialdehyde 2,1-aminomutase